jgi:hypothetical protein
MADSTGTPLVMAEELARLRELAPRWPLELVEAWKHSLVDLTSEHSALTVIFTMLVAAVALELLGNLKLKSVMKSFETGEKADASALCVFALIRMAFGFASLMLFWIGGEIVIQFMVSDDAPRAIATAELLSVIIAMRVMVIVSGAIFSPYDESLRILSIDTGDAQTFHRSLDGGIHLLLQLRRIGGNNGIFRGH